MNLAQGVYLFLEVIIVLGLIRAARGGFYQAVWLLAGVNLAGIAIFSAGHRFDLGPMMSIGVFVWGVSALLGGFYCFYFKTGKLEEGNSFKAVKRPDFFKFRPRIIFGA